MGNTTSQQNHSQSALKRFSSPRQHHPRHQSLGRGSQPTGTPNSSTIFDSTSSSRGRNSSDIRESRDIRKDSGKERDGKHHVHRSLRTKKKSLELPDLAPLSLNPYQPTTSTSGRPSPTSLTKTPPISIPGQQETNRYRSVNVVDFYQPPQPQSAQPTYRDPTSPHKNGHQQSVQPTAPHVPYPSPSSFLQASITPTPGLPTPYAFADSSRESSRSPGSDSSSIATPGRSSFDDHTGDITITAEPENIVDSSQFNPFTVNSSIPLGILKIEEDVIPPLSLPTIPIIPDFIGSPQSEPDVTKRRRSSDGGDPEEIMVKVTWNGGGNEVFLARQGDEKYMNRVKMEREGSSSTFTTSLSLAPGTHHLRFFVDEQWRVADDLPATVDDLGGLANYVAVGPGFADKTLPSSPRPTSPPSSTTTSAILPSTPKSGLAHAISTGYSFWDQPDDDDDETQPTPTIPPAPPRHVRNQAAGSSPVGLTRQTTTSAYVPKWTNEIPLELIEAAAQEEAFLAHQQAQQAHYYNHGKNFPRTQHGFMPLPNIPHAPRLPRILEKLILNQQQIVRNTVPTESAGAPLAGASLASPGGITHRIGGIPTQNRERESRDRIRSPVRERERERERERGGGPDRRRERDKRSLGMTIATSVEEKELDFSDSRDQEDRPLPVVTASGTDVTGIKEKPSSPPSRDREGRPMSPPSRSERSDGMARHPPVVDNRTIADDSSVLPVPSHVVIHHLCTSAIKNGVLGVGATTRYRKKYMTSVYYKPT